MTTDLEPVPEDWERALIVVAHPDDIEFGSSGAVAAWTAAGKTVHYLILSRGEAGIDSMPPEKAGEVREREQRASAEIVGVADVEFLDYADGSISYSETLRDHIAAAIVRHRPELLVGYNHHDVTFSGKWNTSDHRNVGRATLDAVGVAANRWLGRDPSDGDPSAADGDELLWAGIKHVFMAASPNPTHAVDVTDSLDAAVASVEAHVEYLAGLGLPEGAARFGLEQLTSSVAERFGDRPAVPFECVDV
ncbi:N-acetylglucosaminyl deacetylase, LmbE family [Jatrophihabitans endophyticus]|uniref:N-acetylglucosaminyl deacetylase, LmbE family n=1 Tax=Jatrophihabitans endophyticus TaxID=1206085 RepID=A0A1M5I457_9ACTN|nr:PIG-L deacetylase family protein [Jatrophihabitans endophyticus]SHG23076.1 N-acetylglucosaminyl deacetylase, LmbE family [Jatrophihabitans endophyticus]